MTFLKTLLPFFQYRYKQLGCQGAVNGVSFTYTETKPALHQPATLEEAWEETGGEYPDQSTLEEKEFIVNDFSVSTDRAQYLYFQTNGSQTLASQNLFLIFVFFHLESMKA